MSINERSNSEISLKCCLNGCDAQVIAKAVQSLSKFGSYLFVEGDESALTLRSINLSQSAVGTFKFNRIFFTSYSVVKNQESYCKLPMKAAVAMFRNMKQVEQCELKILPNQCKLQIQLKCRLETVKNTFISIIDEENINADVSLNCHENIIIGTHRIFNEISSNFNVVEEEISLEARQNSVTVKNYVEGSRVNDKFMRSQLKLEPEEFEKYKVIKEATITFCLKEFRAFLMFAESINENIFFSFQDGGKPILLKIKKGDHIECALIMSTLCPDDISFYVDCNERELTESTLNKPSTTKRKRCNSDGNKTAHKTKKPIADETTQSNDSAIFQFNDSNRRCLTNEKMLSVTAANSMNITESEQHSNDVLITFVETPDNQGEFGDEFIPQSPQKGQGINKIRSIFSRCFESTYIPKEPTPNNVVFAPNSDTED